MVGDKTVIVAGIGCRRGCPAEDIVALVRRAAAEAHCDASALAAPEFRASEPGLLRAAATLALPLLLVDREGLAAAQSRCVTRSQRAEQTTGFTSVAEAAALSAAGPAATLVMARIAGSRATCAIARGGAT